MSQLRLAYSANGTPSSRKKSKRSTVVLPLLQPVLWKIELLRSLRPAAVVVIEGLVDDLLREARGEKL